MNESGKGPIQAGGQAGGGSAQHDDERARVPLTHPTPENPSDALPEKGPLSPVGAITSVISPTLGLGPLSVHFVSRMGPFPGLCGKGSHAKGSHLSLYSTSTKET